MCQWRIMIILGRMRRVILIRLGFWMGCIRGIKKKGPKKLQNHVCFIIY